MMNKELIITNLAAEKILFLRDKEEKSNLFFRISVKGGGCAGFQYNFGFTQNKERDDELFTKNDVQILVDKTSLNFINGSKIDYVNELIGSSFKIINPQASSSCGCGTSFSI